MGKEDKEIKVTDKRMFTPDGRLREEYSFLEEDRPAAAEAPQPPQQPQQPQQNTAKDPARAGAGQAPGPGEPEPGRDARGARDRTQDLSGGWERDERQERHDRQGRRDEGRRREAPQPFAEEPTARLEIPDSSPGPAPSFFDLAAMLAEPVAVYLGDVDLPDGQSAESLEMARLHIDLLDVLRQKTAGNLTAQEAAFLEDLLYRLRVRYVQKRG